MKNFINKFLLVLLVFTIGACEFDLLDDPNNVTISSADPNALLVNIQTGFAGVYQTFQNRGAQVTRIHHLGGDVWQTAYSQIAMNGSWPYSGVLQNINALKTIGEERNLRRHMGIAKTLEAYVWMLLVDTYGDVPFSQAFDAGNFNPGRDSGADVYKAALDLLVSAQADFDATNSVGTPTDLFLSNNYARWKKVNNAFQLKYHLNLRLTNAGASASAINALIGAGLPDVGDEFVFRYGTNLQDPFTRHPQYSPQGGGQYLSNYFMWYITESKDENPGQATTSFDPRAEYYFYRQTVNNTTNEAELRCINEFPPQHYSFDDVFCRPGQRGYWGRDHLDPQGIPPDGLLRSQHGIYPAGAAFDIGTGGALNPTNNPGSTGAGIQAIMLPAYVDFMLAEAAQTIGSNGDPKALLESAIRKHINYVRSWSLTTNQAARIMGFVSNEQHAAKLDAYVNRVLSDFDATSDKMEIIGREYWLSCFGAGHEAYNLYRRTGILGKQQKAQNPDPGPFPRSFFYPSNNVERNSNADQKPGLTIKVFWDNNPDGFID